MQTAVLTHPQIFETFKRRKFALLRDDSADTQRAIFVAPAIESSAEVINEIISLTGGLCFVALSAERAQALLLPAMPEPDGFGRNERLSNCTVSVEAREGITTGISAGDRSVTVRCLGATEPNPRALISPGHIFPVLAKTGGTLVKNALIEGALDLVRCAGYTDAALFVEFLNADGEFASPAEQDSICAQQGIPALSLSDLIRYRLANEPLVEFVAEAQLPTLRGGLFRSRVYRSLVHEGEHLVLIKGEISPEVPVLTRVHRENPLGDIFYSKQPATRTIIDQALHLLAHSDRGVFLYLRQPVDRLSTPTGSDLSKKSQMLREYGIGAQILRDIGATKIELLSNSEQSLVGLGTFGIEIVSTVPLQNAIGAEI